MINKLNTLSLRVKILTVALIILLLVGAVASFRIFSNSNNSTVQEVPLATVTLLPASQLSTNDSTLTITGTLRNKSEADLRVEVPGQVTGVYTQVGSYVKSGTLIAEVENKAQKAQVTQALGALEAAKAQAKASLAQLSKVQNGATYEDKSIVASQVSAAKANLASAYDAARNALRSAYASSSSTISFSADTMLNNASSVNPTLLFQTTEYSAKISTENMRVAMGDILARHKTQASGKITTEVIDSELATTLSELTSVKQFTDTLLIALDGAITTVSIPASTISTYITTMSSARSLLLRNISTLTGAQSSITAAKKALYTAQKNEDKVLTGARKEDVDTALASVDAANASVTTALGAYQASLAVLEKTRVRATISGTLSSFSARRGDFIGTNELGRIVGTGGSEVVFYIPSTDSFRVTIGNNVIISNTYYGQITTIASSTAVGSGQLEVRANLFNKPNLPNGSTVTVKVSTSDSYEIVDTDNIVTELLVPINAIKFNIDGVNMFTVANPTAKTTKLVTLDITLGDVLGNMVKVSGINKDTVVVTDARGLSAGQIVIVK